MPRPPVRRGFVLLIACVAACFPVRADGPPPASQPAGVLSVPVEEQPFDPAEHLLGDVGGLRTDLAWHGIRIDPTLIFDYTKVLKGGLNTRSEAYHQRFDVALTFDTERLLGLHGGTVFAVYQDQHGPHSSHVLVGDAQNVNFGTNADGRSQLGQLWYQQKFFDDTFRVKLGKMDANADFDVLENGAEFLNNSFATSPTLYLMPSFPDNGTGVELFYEPKSEFYAGFGAFDGSGAEGKRLGELGPGTFFDRDDNVFLIAEVGQHYKLRGSNGAKLPGKLAAGAWWSTDPFDRLAGSGRTAGTGGVYAVCDQLLWKPHRQRPIPAGVPGQRPEAGPEEEEFPGGIASTFSVSWCDPRVNPIDVNAVAGFTWTGLVPTRKIDVLGLGATWAHFAGDFNTRNPYELAFEAFYRIRFTRFVSLKPDLQYVIHPTGSGFPGEPLRRDALVLTMRLEMAF